MNLGPILILGGAAVLVIGAMFYFGMKLARTIERKAPTELSVQLTRTGLTLYGCMTAVLVLFAAAATLEIRFTADRLVLFESLTGGGPARYEPLLVAGSRHELAVYARNRVARIYPVYWLLLLGGFVVGGFSEARA